MAAPIRPEEVFAGLVEEKSKKAVEGVRKLRKGGTVRAVPSQASRFLLREKSEACDTSISERGP